MNGTSSEPVFQPEFDDISRETKADTFIIMLEIEPFPQCFLMLVDIGQVKSIKLRSWYSCGNGWKWNKNRLFFLIHIIWFCNTYFLKVISVTKIHQEKGLLPRWSKAKELNS